MSGRPLSHVGLPAFLSAEPASCWAEPWVPWLPRDCELGTQEMGNPVLPTPLTSEHLYPPRTLRPQAVSTSVSPLSATETADPLPVSVDQPVPDISTNRSR